MSTSICQLELTRNVLQSRPGGVKDSHLHYTTEIRDKRRLHGPPGSSVKDLAYLLQQKRHVFIESV